MEIVLNSLKIVVVYCLLCVGTSTPVFAQDLDFLLQKTQPQGTEGIFSQIYQRSSTYVEEQTVLEMERFLTKFTKDMQLRLTQSDVLPLVEGGCLLPEQAQRIVSLSDSYQGSQGGTLYTNFSSVTYFKETCAKFRTLNTRFVQTLITLEYKNVFLDGDTDNSTFDLLADVAALKYRIDGKNEDIIPSWHRTVSPDVQYLEGKWSTPVYESLDKTQLDIMKKNTVFKDQSLSLGKQCVLGDGPVDVRQSTFSDTEKNALVERIAQYEQAKNVVDPSFDNTVLMTKDTRGLFQKALEKAQQTLNTVVDNGAKGCASFQSASACLSLTLVGGRTTHASITQNALTVVPSLQDSIAHLTESTNELSAQNLQLKNEPRSVFSFGWQDLRFVLPKEPIKIEYVPMVPLIAKEDYTTPQVFKDFGSLWDAATTQKTMTVNAGTLKDAVSKGNSTNDDAKNYVRLLQPGKISADGVRDMEKTVGAQLDFFLGELRLWTTHVQQMQTHAQQFTRKPVITP